MKSQAIGLVSVFALVAMGGVASAGDITGVWSIDGHKKSRLLIERQGEIVKVALSGAQSVGLRENWYVGQSKASAKKAQAVTLVAPKLTPPDKGAEALPTRDREKIKIQLEDDFRGVLKIGGESLPIERKELEADGLIAALDPHAPETGFYENRDDPEGVSFIEVQGGRAFLTRLSVSEGAATTAMIAADKGDDFTWSGPKGSIVSRVGRQGGSRFAFENKKGKTFKAVREQFARVDEPFVMDESSSVEGPDENGDGVRDDIGVAIFDGAYKSSRLREGLMEIARAYRGYLVAPSAETAIAAIEQATLAKTCLQALGPSAGVEAVVLIEGLTFNTAARLAAEAEMIRLAGSLEFPQSTVSLANPNACAFMQGVARRYDDLKAADVRAAQASPRPAPQERAIAARRPAPPPPANQSAATCADTKILLLTGVMTDGNGASKDKDLLEQKIKATGINTETFQFDAKADPNPGLFNDAIQYIVGKLNLSFLEAGVVARTGFAYAVKGRKVERLQVTSRGIETLSLLIPNAALSEIVRLYARAVVENATDEAAIANGISDDVDNDLRVIAVAHSRGNLRANRAYGLLAPDARRSVAIASVANADKDVASGGLGATRDDDKIIAWADTVFDVQDPTIRKAGEPKDWFGHYLKDSYLNNPVALPHVMQRVREALVKAEIPPGASERVLAEQSGGYTGPAGDKREFKIGRNGVTFSFRYEAYGIPDTFKVFHRGKEVASTGRAVSGSGTLTVDLPSDATNPTNGDISVVVYGPDKGTAWDYEVVCPKRPSAKISALQSPPGR